MCPISDDKTPPAPFDLKPFKRQSKQLLRSFKEGDPTAVEMVNRYFANSRPESFRLAQAQLVVARSLGFPSWTKLKSASSGGQSAASRAGSLRPRTQPHHMRTRHYQYGVETLDGDQVWSMFEACRAGDAAEVGHLIEQDSRLVNAQNWYQFPIHLAVSQGHPRVVRLLLQAGAEPGQSRFMYDSWQDLLGMAEERGASEISRMLEAALRERYGYDPEFESYVKLVKARRPQDIMVLLEKSPHLARAADCHGNAGLHWAALSRQIELIEPLVSLGADPNRRRSDGQTPAQLVINGDYSFRVYRELAGLEVPSAGQVIQQLLRSGAEYDLSIASALGDQQQVSTLLAGNSPLARHLDSGRRSPLKYAAEAGHLEIVRMLLDGGADPNLPEELATRGHALWSACAGNHYEVVKLLLEHGADPNAEVDSSGSCSYIAEHRGPGARPVVDLLLRHGAYRKAWALDAAEMALALKENARVVQDSDFLGEALARNDLALVELLREKDPNFVERLHGGNLRMPNPDVSISDNAVLARLLELGFDPNRPDWLGKTALHHYAERGETGNLMLLLEHGADIDAVDDTYCGTPLAWAARKGKIESVRVLLEHGADPQIPLERPWAQPLARALKRGYDEIAEVLKGARSF